MKPLLHQAGMELSVGFPCKGMEKDQGGPNSMHDMEIYPVNGNSTRGWMDIRPSGSKSLDGNPTKLFKDTQQNTNPQKLNNPKKNQKRAFHVAVACWALRSMTTFEARSGLKSSYIFPSLPPLSTSSSPSGSWHEEVEEGDGGDDEGYQHESCCWILRNQRMILRLRRSSRLPD